MSKPFKNPSVDLAAFADRPLWDLMEDLMFWVKDVQGRFVWCNLALAESARLSREEVLGTLDSDLYFNELAMVYMEDDASLIRGGPPIVNKPELVMASTGVVGWNMTSKYPILSAEGEVIGTYGMSRPVDHSVDLPADYADLADLVTFAHRELKNGISVEDLTLRAGLSRSSLERYLRRHLRITPRELLQRIRTNHARHLLQASTLKIGEIALECGYESFSAFSRAFKQRFGSSPGQFRERR
ncbi:helix-turn-helix domain-containing protein [Puniceicoccus vermicola]|uniref:Helix-turn-helix domain-containing protein n=1 Tax=Puniceicoccus vermicola TaxID=388746 RepID=A0A7X1B2A4_9BACT|nr:helix-turn-helix domain-containing protein [Puniceicoccus vermicola]MBC2604330.1 helix-turn-helix domain-containing protein [Puniceicoccus vermicola]